MNDIRTISLSTGLNDQSLSNWHVRQWKITLLVIAELTYSYGAAANDQHHNFLKNGQHGLKVVTISSSDNRAKSLNKL